MEVAGRLGKTGKQRNASRKKSYMKDAIYWPIETYYLRPKIRVKRE